MPSTDGEAPIRAAAAFAAELRLEDVPPEVLGRIDRLFGDFVGNCIGGTVVDEVRRIHDLTVDRSPGGGSTVLATGRLVHPIDAAYVNGAAADALERQDGYRFGGYHPSHVLPPLLALAEQLDVDGEDLALAVVIAYEVANRVARDLHPEATLKGWFPLAAAFGSAAGCAKLLGLDAEGIANALGCVPFFNPAIPIDGLFAGPSIKPAFAGQFARAGLEAALHAQAGLTGWTEALEADRGVLNLLGGSGRVTAGASYGVEWTILEVHQKGVAGCRHTHGATEAVLGIAPGGRIRAEEIDRIDVRTYEVAKLLVDRRTGVGSSASAGVLSLPYTVAAALLDGEMGPDQFRAERMADPVVHELAGRVSISVSPELEARYPAETVSEVRVTLRDGTELQGSVPIQMGDPRRPLTDQQYTEKLRANLEVLLTPDAAAAVIRRLAGGIVGLGRVRDLIGAVVPAGATERLTAADGGPTGPRRIRG